MTLDLYQLQILKDIRTDERPSGIKIISLTTGAGYSALDAYRQQSYTEVSSFFSGALLFNPFSEKMDSPGGFYNTSDIAIVCSRDNKSTLEAKDVKIEYENVKFRISKIIDCENTNEIVIYASRLE